MRVLIPAHDFVREQHSTHFWVFILTFVDNYLTDKTRHNVVNNLATNRLQILRHHSLLLYLD